VGRLRNYVQQEAATADKPAELQAELQSDRILH